VFTLNLYAQTDNNKLVAAQKLMLDANLLLGTGGRYSIDFGWNIGWV